MKRKRPEKTGSSLCIWETGPHTRRRRPEDPSSASLLLIFFFKSIIIALSSVRGTVGRRAVSDRAIPGTGTEGGSGPVCAAGIRISRFFLSGEVSGYRDVEGHVLGGGIELVFRRPVDDFYDGLRGLPAGLPPRSPASKNPFFLRMRVYGPVL